MVGPMEQHNFFSVAKLVIRKVSNDIPVGICRVTEALLKNELKFAFILQQIFTLFSCIDGSNVMEKLNEVEERHKLSNFN